MGRIQSSVGLVTGVAIEDTVNQLMKLNAIPRNRLMSRNETLQKEQVALTELTALVVGVQLSTDRLGQSSLFTATKVASSKSDVLSARSTGAPKTGSYSFMPVRQAQSQQITSSLFSSSDQTLSPGELVIHTGGFLDDSVNLDELNAGSGVSRGKIRITDRAGSKQTIDLRFAQTANDVVDAINANDALNVVASLREDRFVLTDISGGTISELKVEEFGGGTTAKDLGLGGVSTTSTSATGTGLRSLNGSTALKSLLDRRGLDLRSTGELLKFQLKDGSSVNFATQLDSNTASLGQFVFDMNAAGNGKFEVRISANGNSLEVEDLTSGSGSFSVSSPTGSLAHQLGFDNASVGGVIAGDRLISGLGNVLLSSLGGGQGLGPLGQLTLTDRSGITQTVDLSSAETLENVIETINASSVGVQARLNRTKTGLEIVDTTGSTSGNLIIANGDAKNSATQLKIEKNVADSSIDSGSLRRQFIGRNTRLDTFNRGEPLSLGSIRLTDSSGAESALNLATKKPQTMGELIDAINNLGIAVQASINDAGDGIQIVDQAGGTGQFTVSDVGTGSSAKQLGIVGTGKQISVNGASVTGINGSRTIRLSTTAETTVTALAEQLNALSSGPVNASLLNLSTTGGVRLLLNGAATGASNRVAVDSNIGISFSETTQSRDALLAFGATESSGGVLVASTTNTFAGIVGDLEFTIAGTSTTPVTVSVSENSESIAKQLETFVSQFNKLRDKFETLTKYDESTKSVGILFGSNVALRVDSGYGRFFSSSIRGAGSLNSLAQVGVRLNDKGRLEFDKDKLDTALAKDPGAVQEFFTHETSGFSVKAKEISDRLAGVDNGPLLNRSTSLQGQIEQNARRVDSFDVRLDKQRTRLLTQFYNMEQAIAKLQTNLTALNQMQTIPPMYSSR